MLRNSQTVDVDYLEFTNTWRVSGKNIEPGSIKINQTFGTRRANAYEIYESSLNLQSITIRDPVTYLDADGNEQVKYVVNAKETMIARAKQQQMKEAFASWLFRDKTRADTLLSIYNEKFNTIRPRAYSGDHLIFQAMNEEMSLRKHQKDVAARIIYSGTALMAHEVGAGKTAAMIASGMYLKRIGAIHKPLYCVPNHLTEQWANEFLRFFPSANLLVTTKRILRYPIASVLYPVLLWASTMQSSLATANSRKSRSPGSDRKSSYRTKSAMFPRRLTKSKKKRATTGVSSRWLFLKTTSNLD